MKKILALVFAIIFIISCLTACDSTQAPSAEPETDAVSEVESESETEAVTEEVAVAPKELLLSKNGKMLFTVVTPAGASSDLNDVTQTLITKLAKLTGALVKAMDDTTYDGNVEDSEYEIIIGNCLRTDTQNVLDGIAYNDYKITVTDKNVVIASRNESSAVSALWKFISLLNEDGIIRTGDSKAVTLVWSEDIFYAGKAGKYAGMTLSGMNIEGYRLVYPSAGSDSKVYKRYAEELRDWIGENTGFVLDVVSDSEKAVTKEILIGKTSRSQSKEYYEKYSLNYLQYGIKLKNGKLQIAGAMPFSTQYAVGIFEQMVKEKNGVLDAFDTGIQTMTEIYRKNIADYRFMEWNVLNSAWVDLVSSGHIPPEVSVRKEIVTAAILGFSPDVISFCEFFTDWGNQIPSLIADEYTFVEAKYKWDSNRSPLAYKTSRFDLVASGVESIETYVNENNRCVTWAVLKDKETDAQIIAFSTHYNPDGGDTGEADRLTQAQKTLEIIEGVTEQYDGAVVLMGDFNTTAGKAAYQLLDTKYDDAFNGSGIDHIFYDPNQMSVAQIRTESEQFTTHVSDHNPRMVDVYLK